MEKKLIQSLDSNYNFIKGRIAEAIIERLFISLNMIPIPNGYEIKHPDIAHLRRTGQLAKDAIKRIEFGCDFIIRSTEKNAKGQYDVYQVEVKFSKDGYVETKRLDVYDSDDIIFIFVSFDGFWCVSNREVKAMNPTERLKKLYFSQLSKLEDHSIFSFSESQKLIIKQFMHFVHATLEKLQPNKDFKESLALAETMEE